MGNIFGSKRKLTQLKDFCEVPDESVQDIRIIVHSSETLTATTSTTWKICGKEHSLPQIQRNGFAATEKRSENQNLCYNCMKKGHGINQCPPSGRCCVCSRKHHSLLHSDRTTSDWKKMAVDAKTFVPRTQSLLAEDGTQPQILLATARVKVQNGNVKSSNRFRIATKLHNKVSCSVIRMTKAICKDPNMRSRSKS